MLISDELFTEMWYNLNINSKTVLFLCWVWHLALVLVLGNTFRIVLMLVSHAFIGAIQSKHHLV